MTLNGSFFPQRLKRMTRQFLPPLPATTAAAGTTLAPASSVLLSTARRGPTFPPASAARSARQRPQKLLGRRKDQRGRNCRWITETTQLHKIIRLSLLTKSYLIILCLICHFLMHKKTIKYDSIFFNRYSNLNSFHGEITFLKIWI